MPWDINVIILELCKEAHDMTKLFFINEAHTEGLLLLILCLFYQTSREEIYSLIIKVISDFLIIWRIYSMPKKL